MCDILKSNDPFPEQMWPGQCSHLKAILVLPLGDDWEREHIMRQKSGERGMGILPLLYNPYNPILFTCIFFKRSVSIWLLTIEWSLTSSSFTDSPLRATVEEPRGGARLRPGSDANERKGGFGPLVSCLLFLICKMWKFDWRASQHHGEVLKVANYTFYTSRISPPFYE